MFSITIVSCIVVIVAIVAMCCFHHHIFIYVRFLGVQYITITPSVHNVITYHFSGRWFVFVRFLFDHV